MKNNEENIKQTKTIKSGKHLLGTLQNLYCSCQSEFSAFLLFNYQYLVLKNKHKKIAELLKSFADKNLSNSHILAEKIISLKGLPFYLNSQNSPLTAFWLNYEANIENIIEMDKRFLQTLVCNYTYSIEKISNKNLIKNLEFLKSENLKNLEELNLFKI